MKRHMALLLTALLSALALLTGCSAVDAVAKKFGATPSAEELLNNIPTMDENKYNSFKFKMDIVGVTKNQDGGEYSISGSLETYQSVSHMYAMNVDTSKAGAHMEPETWADFSADERYTNMGNGFYISTIANPKVVYDLADVINTRTNDLLLTDTGSSYTLSWVFVHDSNYLFERLMSRFTNDLELDGSGRITAVMNRDTLEFEYFTVIVSASNEEGMGAIIDAVFEWEDVNADGTLEIPIEVSASAYEQATGIITDGGYDTDINPVAEAFASSYGGIVEITHYDGGASMFWTDEEDGSQSATLIYMKTEDAHRLYEESCEFLTLFCGNPFEKMDGGAYYYDEPTAQLALVMDGDGWYAEIIITGGPDSTQGDLRKSLITYKSKFETVKGGS